MAAHNFVHCSFDFTYQERQRDRPDDALATQHYLLGFVEGANSGKIS